MLLKIKISTLKLKSNYQTSKRLKSLTDDMSKNLNTMFRKEEELQVSIETRNSITRKKRRYFTRKKEIILERKHKKLIKNILIMSTLVKDQEKIINKISM